MSAIRAGLVTFIFVAGAVSPAVAGDARGDLARRVAAAASGGPVRTAYAALPPGYALPNPAPELSLLGSSWLAGTSPPDDVRIYYRAAPGADTTLAAALSRRGYVRVAASGLTSLFVGDDGAQRHWCPRDYGPALVVTAVPAGALRAIDVRVVRSSGDLCPGASRVRTAVGAPLPVLGNIAGVAIGAPSRSEQPNRITSTAVVRSALLESDVLARLDARFAAAGWRGEPAVFEGETLQQRFVRDDGSTRWVLDLRLDQRASDTYDATITAGPLRP